MAVEPLPAPSPPIEEEKGVSEPQPPSEEEEIQALYMHEMGFATIVEMLIKH